MEKYETIEQLGEGAFAVVTKAKDLSTESIVAIKKLKKKYHNWQECVDLREVKSLNVLKNHENIIKLKEMRRVEEILYLVFEYMEKNLYELMLQKQSKKFSENQIKCVMWQTLQGLAYMHKYGFFHRDMKPENLLVSGDLIKIADFGLAREIRSLPPYTDYVSTRYYRAPECILKSTNYNSPIDVWAVGCIMIEMYNQKPIFVGNTEKEVLFRMCSVLGTPNINTWPEGLQMAKKIDLKFPTSPGLPLSQVVPDASKEALDFLGEMLRWDPNKRSTASNLLQHPFFTSAPIPTRISTPEYNGNFNLSGSNVKRYSNAPRVIKKMKDQKIEEDTKYKDMSPITNKLDDEFDFDMPTYFKDNQSGIDNKTLYMNNSILNANLSNIGMGNSLLGSTLTNNQTQTQSIYNYNKNFFDTTTIKNINGGHGSRNGSIGSGSNGSDEKDQIDINAKESSPTADDLFGRRKLLNVNVNNNLGGIIETVNYEIIKKEEEKKKHIEQIENEINLMNKKSKKEMDFENCNVYLKPKENNQSNEGRKRSAIRFLENTLDNNTQNLSNSVKSTKDPINDKNAGINSFNTGLSNGINSKPPLIKTTSIGNPQPEKKEFQSRRKNQTNNILNDLDNPKVVDLNLNLNTNFTSNKNELQPSNFRKNNSNFSGSNTNLTNNNQKEMVIGENPYSSSKKTYNNSSTNSTSDTGLGLFNSRRHINNTASLNGLSQNNPKPASKDSNKEKQKFLII